MNKQTIQHHGKVYDAVTGRVIADVVPPKNYSPASARAPKIPRTSPGRKAANPNRHHTPRPASTLMRHAVKKPTSISKRQLHVKHEIQHNAIEVQSADGKSSLDTARLSRAQQVQKSSAVNRFYALEHVPVTYAAVPVQQPPTANTAPAPEAPPPVSTTQFADMFDRAVAQANHYVDIASEKTHFKKKARRHAATMGAGALTLLILAGLTTYMNTPRLQMKVAGVVAGVSTNTPDFQAAGFEYNGVTVHGTKLVYGLKQGNIQYRLIEQPTNWDGQAMIDQIASISADGTPNYRTLSIERQAIYKFNNRHATWVKNGTWYQLHGDGSFTDQQLVALARNS